LNKLFSELNLRFFQKAGLTRYYRLIVQVWVKISFIMRKIFLVVFFLLVSFIYGDVVFGQSSVMKTPGKYLMPMDNASLALAGSVKKQGELWAVFSDRPNNPLYSDKGCSSSSGKKLDFMQPMYVISETETSVRVIAITDADMAGNILNNAASTAGWIKKENLLLNKTCLKTRDVKLPEFRDGIFNKKAMVLNLLSAGQQMRVPEFYSNPRCSPNDSINSALVYQINYVYKETPTAYLLGELPDIIDVANDASKIKGWVLKSQTTAWNHRLAYEMNWDEKAVAERKSKGVKAKIYSTKAASGTTLHEESAGYYSRRDIGEVDRYPVLDVFNGVSEVGVIGDLKAENGKSLSSFEFAKIKHVIDSMSASLRNVNVIFVIDATSSMIPYSKAIQDAIKNAMRDLRNSNNNYRFGVLLYRDASEGKGNEINFSRDLTSNYNGVNSNISRFMTPTFNKCNNDAPEAVFYGIKKAIERFDPPSGESNYVILIGDCGNHSRTTYTDCTGKTQPDYTNVSEKELVDLFVKKNINLFAYQVQHQVAADARPAYDSFRSQVESLMKKTVLQSNGGAVLSDAQVFNKKVKGVVEINNDLGIPGYFQMAPDGGSMHPTVLTKSLSSGIGKIDDKVNNELDGISQYLNGKIEGVNAKQIKSFIDKLEAKNISPDKLNIVFQKNGQIYNKGYVKRYESGLKSPVYQDVLLMSQTELLQIKKSLERLIPTDERALSSNESRSFIVYGWGEILVDILGYFPETNEAIDTLSLYTLSAILTGWGGKEKFKKIKLLDVTQPTRFPDEMLYEYLIDWCITKGHIQSISEGQNLLTEDYYNDHKWTIFSEYLVQLTKGAKEEDPTMGAKFAQYFKKYDKEYNKYTASFRIPMGTGSGLKHYWIDSRIFPHNVTEFGDEDLIDYLYKDFKK